MGEAPRMYAPILRDEDDVIWVDGQPLTEEEREIAAVAVACYRRGWDLWAHRNDPDEDREWTVWAGVHTPHGGDSPYEAYARALEAQDPHTTGGE